MEHYEQIYAQKCEYYRQFFIDISRSDYWVNRGFKRGSDRLVKELSRISDLDHFVDYFVAYYGVPKDKWFSSSPARQWLLRYVPLSRLSSVNPSKRSFVFKDERLYEDIIGKVCTVLNI